MPTDVPMTSGLLERVALQLTEAYPGITSRVLTSSAFGRPVLHLTLGQGERQVLYTAAHHANEWITATLLLKFAEDLAQAAAQGGRLFGVEAKNILNAATVHLVPMVDPDGVDLVTGAISPGTPEYETAQMIAGDFPGIPFPDGWKANLLGVDLNLQYPAGWLQARQIKFAQGFNRPAPRDFVGRAPLSQRESFALARLTRELDPALMLAYHTQGRVIYWQFQDYEVPGAQAYAREFARLSGYDLGEPAYASSFAGFKDWFIQRFRRPGFTVEAGQGENPLPIAQFDEIYRDNLGILVTGATGLPGNPQESAE
ncbi:MAG: M14 family metallocarboxypeptidase [Eubacteriales bacterium]|nr:M14 family metallocarboxypeptidase [Eubacteriales bacterium]